LVAQTSITPSTKRRALRQHSPHPEVWFPLTDRHSLGVGNTPAFQPPGSKLGWLLDL
jgi:hypothetical protein